MSDKYLYLHHPDCLNIFIWWMDIYYQFKKSSCMSLCHFLSACLPQKFVSILFVFFNIYKISPVEKDYLKLHYKRLDWRYFRFCRLQSLSQVLSSATVKDFGKEHVFLLHSWKPSRLSAYYKYPSNTSIFHVIAVQNFYLHFS